MTCCRISLLVRRCTDCSLLFSTASASFCAAALASAACCLTTSAIACTSKHMTTHPVYLESGVYRSSRHWVCLYAVNRASRDCLNKSMNAQERQQDQRLLINYVHAYTGNTCRPYLNCDFIWKTHGMTPALTGNGLQDFLQNLLAQGGAV